MANEYKLSYTAEEINNKLGQIDGLSEEIADLKNAGYVKQAEMETYINETFLGGEW